MARLTRRLVAALVATVLVMPGIAAGADPSELESTRDQLADASRDLADLEEQVRRVSDEVAALDERLTSATTELAQVEDALAGAQAALAAAVADERGAAAALADADADLDAVVDDLDANRSRLQQRAVLAFKHGGSTPHDLLIRGVAGAGDWHEVAVTLETVGRLVADDRALVDDRITLTRSTADLRAASGAARADALAAARTAADEERRVAELVARHERVVTEVEDQHTKRAAVLAGLEADSSARALLVRQLERRIEELELAAITVLVPVDVNLDVYGPAPAWAAGLPPAGRPYAAAIEAISARHGLDGRLLAALVWTESNFRPDAVSHAGALGLAQLMPGTARGLGVDPRDPLQNLDGGARYLRAQLDRFGTVDLALAAYNAGPGRVQRAGNAIPDIVETQLYVVRVLDRYHKLAG